MAQSLKKIVFFSLAVLLFTQYTHPKGFADIQGQVPFELKDIVNNLSDSQKKPDSNLPKGIMLVGRPGSGKTNLFRALSEELPANSFVYMSAINLQDPKKVDELFDTAEYKARQNYHGKCIIMIDDFDSFGISNNTMLDQNNTPANIVALMNQLSGFKKNDRLIVITASHNVTIHPDLGRALKMDEVIELSLPDLSLRLTMLKKFNEDQKSFAYSINLNQIASLTYDFTPAELLKLIQKANLLARQASQSSVSQQDLIDALKGILAAKGRFDKDIMIRIKALENLLNGKQEPTGFDRIIGTIPDDVKQFIEQLNGTNSAYARFDVKPAQGILFTGPPGTGKTTLALAIAEEVNCPFISISGSEFSQSLVGGGKDVVKNLFNNARQKAQNSATKRAIIFIDEVDSIGSRSGNVLDSTINEMITQMEGINNDNQGTSITVIGATNHLQNVDSALLSRFKKQMEIGLPDEPTRKELVKFYLRKQPHNCTAHFQKIAEALECFVPREIKELAEKATLLAIKDKAQRIELKHAIEAIKQEIHRKILSGEQGAAQQLDRIDVIFNGKASSKGFNQIIGGVPDEIKDMLQLMQGDPSIARDLDLDPPSGYLFSGPPGTGKTLLAKAIAEELGCGFIAKTGSDFVEQYVGMGAQRVRELFKNARDKAKGNRFGKTIIFIDEIDAIGKRSSGPFQSEETTRTITAFIAEMDGITKDDSVIVIGATNNPNNIDEAILSRLEGVVKIGLPNHIKRKALLAFNCKKRTLVNVNLDTIATQTKGYDARKIKQLCKSAARNALRSGQRTISQAHFDRAIADMNASKQNQNIAYI